MYQEHSSSLCHRLRFIALWGLFNQKNLGSRTSAVQLSWNLGSFLRTGLRFHQIEPEEPWILWFPFRTTFYGSMPPKSTLCVQTFLGGVPSAPRVVYVQLYERSAAISVTFLCRGLEGHALNMISKAFCCSCRSKDAFYGHSLY
jgi:hypothetical protein